MVKGLGLLEFRVSGLVFRIVSSPRSWVYDEWGGACLEGAHLLARPLGKLRKLQQPEGFRVI